MTTSATPQATIRIARSYLTDLLAASPDPQWSVAAAVEQLVARGKVRHVMRSGQLVLTFDLADDPAGWSTTRPAEPPLAGQQAAQVTGGQVGVGGTDLTGDQPLDPRPENRDYPGQPGERTAEDYVRATATAVGVDPDAAAAELRNRAGQP